MQFKINKNKPTSKRTNKNNPINLSGTDFKNPNKNKKNHSGKILSDVFKTLTITQDSSWKTKYQFNNTKYENTKAIKKK